MCSDSAHLLPWVLPPPGPHPLGFSSNPVGGEDHPPVRPVDALSSSSPFVPQESWAPNSKCSWVRHGPFTSSHCCLTTENPREKAENLPYSSPSSRVRSKQLHSSQTESHCVSARLLCLTLQMCDCSFTQRTPAKHLRRCQGHMSGSEFRIPAAEGCQAGGGKMS